MSKAPESLPSAAKSANQPPNGNDVTVGVVINITVNVDSSNGTSVKYAKEAMSKPGDPNVPPPRTMVNIVVNSKPGDPNVPPPS